jgi:hypothetical protein
MSFDDLYPIIKEQAMYSVLRYEEPERRKDKISELIAMSWAKYQRDIVAGKEIKKQNHKCFVTQRAKQLDTRSVCVRGYGGTSTIDVLGYYRRRPNSSTQVIQFDNWMTFNPRSKDLVEETFSFQIDFYNFQKTLNEEQNTILSYLIQGYKADKIAEILSLTYQTVRTIINKLKEMFLKFFRPEVLAIP